MVQCHCINRNGAFPYINVIITMSDCVIDRELCCPKAKSFDTMFSTTMPFLVTLLWTVELCI